MKRLVIIGNSSYSKMMKKYIEIYKFGEICAYAVEAEYIKEKYIDGIKVISLEELCDEYRDGKTMLIMGIGYTKMGDVRKKLYEKCKIMGFVFDNYIHPTAIISPDVKMGEGNNILEGVVIESGVEIGNANLIFGGSVVGHESTISDFCTLSVNVTIAGCVIIENNCFLGAGSTAKNHIRLEKYAMLGATAYGFKDIPEYSVVVPAKSLILEDKKSTDYL